MISANIIDELGFFRIRQNTEDIDIDDRIEKGIMLVSNILAY